MLKAEAEGRREGGRRGPSEEVESWEEQGYKPALASGTQAHSARQMGCLTLICRGFWKTLLNQLLHQMKLTSGFFRTVNSHNSATRITIDMTTTPTGAPQLIRLVSGAAQGQV